MQFFRVHHERIVMVGHGRKRGESKKESGLVADIFERIDIGDFEKLLKSSLVRSWLAVSSQFEFKRYSARDTNNSRV